MSTSQAELRAQLKAARTPTGKRDAALALLDATLSRDPLETAIRALSRDEVIDVLGPDQRPIIRDKTAYFFAHPAKDRSGDLRGALLGLLAHVSDSEDRDLFVAGTQIYERKPAIDIAQACRATALIGLAALDLDLACVHATRLLGEPDTSTLNGEPSLTAIRVLAENSQLLPVYHFVLSQGAAFIRDNMGEVVGRAFQALGTEDFPREVYIPLVERFIPHGSPAMLGGIVSAITEIPIPELYNQLKALIRDTHHDDLHRYGLIMLAASREPALLDMLFDLSNKATAARAENFLEAIELTTDPRRDEAVRWLEKLR